MLVVKEKQNEVEERELVNTNRITLSQLSDMANTIQSKCSDHFITGATNDNLRLDDFGGVTYIEDDGEVRSKSITRFALGQLCSKIGVPAQYIDKCIRTGRLELAQDNVSSWLSEYGGNLFIREHDNSIRGVLSQKFSTCDTPEILGVIQDTFPNSDFVVRGYYLSPERFHLRVTEKNSLPIPDDDLFAGFSINSSDVGRSTLSVNYMLYKQVCSNGLCLPKGRGEVFQQKHIGITAEAFREGLKQNIELVPNITDELIKEIERSRNSGVAIKDFDNDKEIEDIIKKLRTSIRMSEEQANKVIELFKYRVTDAEDFKYENNTWGLINSITEVSKNSTLENRIELESNAGILLIA